MPRTLTLKNIPDALYAGLKSTADAHHRSLNGEVIVCLESVLMPQKIWVDERLARARQIRQTLADVACSALMNCGQRCRIRRRTRGDRG